MLDDLRTFNVGQACSKLIQERHVASIANRTTGDSTLNEALASIDIVAALDSGLAMLHTFN